MKSFFMFIGIFVITFASLSSKADNLVKLISKDIKGGRLFGYLAVDTSTGNSQVFAGFDFDQATEFDGNRAVVRFRTELGGQWAIIDKNYPTTKKPVVILNKYDRVSELSEGYAVAHLPSDTYSTGLIDSSGNEVLEFSYYQLGKVSEGFLRFTKTGGREAELWGYLKKNPETGRFEEFKAPKYRSAFDYSNGMAAVKVVKTLEKNGSRYLVDYYFYLDSDGNPHGEFHTAYPFNKGGYAMAQACDGDCSADVYGTAGWGLISKEKLLKTPTTPWSLLPRYPKLSAASESGLAAAGFFYRDCEKETPWEPCVPTFQLIAFDLNRGETKSLKVEGWIPVEALNAKYLLVLNNGRFSGKYKSSILNTKGEMAKGASKYDFLEVVDDSTLIAGSGDTYGVISEKSGKFVWLSKTKIK